MRTFFETIGVAFSMFSALPVPKINWNKQNMRFLLAAFPLVGVVIGILEALWICLSARFAFSMLLTAAGVTVLPILVTGGIHLDGYMDVSDALSSYGDEQKRREILADPHIGAFAVIRLAVLLILTLGFASVLSFESSSRFSSGAGWVLLFVCSFIVSRCLSGLAVAIFPLSKETGLAHTFQSAADRRLCILFLGGQMLVTAVLMIAGGASLGGAGCMIAAVLMLCCASGQWIFLRKTAALKFGGLSGDLNGWFLQKAELWMLAALAMAKAIQACC